MKSGEKDLAFDAPVDLHLHTRYSDGVWPPADLFDALASAAFQVVSVVDHDQLTHLPEVIALGAEHGIAVVAGTEVTTEWRGLPAHLLCYAPLGQGFASDTLRTIIDDTATRMRANTRMIYETMLALGYTFPRQRETLVAQNGDPVRAMDVGQLLIAHGYASGPAEAIAMVTEAGYRQMRAPMEQVVAAAHADGALCVLAHPGRGVGELHRYEPADIEALAGDVALDGVEVYYPTHTPEQVAAYEAVTQRLGLLRSAGSDSHGPDQRMPAHYPARLISALLARLGMNVR